MAEAFDCAAHAAVLRDALQGAMPGVEIGEDAAPDAAALTFVHPAHEATVVLLVEGADAIAPTATLLLAVVVGDWEAVRQQPDGGAALFALNPRLMTCAIGLQQLNEDEVAVVLCRRAPVDAMAPGDVLGVVDDMIWEYARCAGWLQGEAAATPEAPLRPPAPRLIGSLDEL